MKIKGVVTLAAIIVLSRWPAGAQIYDTNNVFVQTFAGSGFSGYLDGQGTQTMFNAPMAIVTDTSGNLFVIDYGNPVRIRKISPNATVTTFAGGGPSGLPGYGTNVMLPAAIAMTIDHSNILYLMDYYGSMMRIGVDGYAATIPLSGLNAGPVSGLCVDSGNNVYISAANKIWRY
jgi:hypothetical protein